MTVKIFLIVISLFGLNVSADIVGQAKVTDGDTIKSGSVRIRLHGIDAPETKQTCKSEAPTTETVAPKVTGTHKLNKRNKTVH